MNIWFEYSAPNYLTFVDDSIIKKNCVIADDLNNFSIQINEANSTWISSVWIVSFRQLQKSINQSIAHFITCPRSIFTRIEIVEWIRHNKFNMFVAISIDLTSTNWIKMHWLYNSIQVFSVPLYEMWANSDMCLIRMYKCCSNIHIW